MIIALALVITAVEVLPVAIGDCVCSIWALVDGLKGGG